MSSCNTDNSNKSKSMYCLIKDSRVQKGQVIGCNPTACPTWDISTLFSVAQSLLLELGQHLLSTEDAQCPPALRIESVPSTHTALLLDACNSFPAGRCPSIHPSILSKNQLIH